MEGRKVSLVAKFDDICRGFNYLINDSDKGKKILAVVLVSVYSRSSFFSLFRIS